MTQMSEIVRESKYNQEVTIQLVQGDLTVEHVDAIVNAANQYLQHGGGIAGAIVRVGGQVIQQESDEWVREHGLVTHNLPAYTSSGRLPCRYVIHAVGPIWGSGGEEAKLSAAVHGALSVADRLSLHSIALPAISTGIFGFPKERAAHIILETIRDYFSKEAETHLSLARIVVIDRPTLAAFEKAWDSAPFE
jgi:O-acetyl-ADP-ribose deacetylase